MLAWLLIVASWCCLPGVQALEAIHPVRLCPAPLAGLPVKPHLARQ